MNTDKTTKTASARPENVRTCYWIEKQFIGGPLKGLRWEGVMTVAWHEDANDDAVESAVANGQQALAAWEGAQS